MLLRPPPSSQRQVSTGDTPLFCSPTCRGRKKKRPSPDSTNTHAWLNGTKSISVDLQNLIEWFKVMWSLKTTPVGWGWRLKVTLSVSSASFLQDHTPCWNRVKSFSSSKHKKDGNGFTEFFVNGFFFYCLVSINIFQCTTNPSDLRAAKWKSSCHFKLKMLCLNVFTRFTF